MGTRHGTHRDMTLEEHLKTAEEIRTAIKNVKRAYFRCQELLGKSHSTSQKLWKLASNTGYFMNIKADLDTNYHKLINDETFSKYGHIYYNEPRNKNKLS